ncbi:WD40 containing snare-dependent exocytosis protein [Mycena albidolilacea]|uniref:WD40 containing snare-dependent exocytosis protein n=1 Tax=Mycena albidolilacea TaxID=1033008 RepID=A0AAD7ALT0_9AGAR|nr:WD40 containing snare-dependent exocytosis protein [Mycena albidolilacea]
MFKHGPVYADLSVDLQDKADWNVAVLRSFDYPLNITTVAIEPITGLLSVGTTNGTIYVFGGPSVEAKLSLLEPIKVKFLQFSSSTFQLVCLDEKSQLHIWDLSTFGKPKFVVSARFANAISLTISPSHSHAFIALESGEIRTYDLLCHRKSDYRIPNMWNLFEEKTMATRINPTATLSFPIETVVHPRDLNLLFVAYSGGIILSDLTQRNTLRAYEFVLPAGAPGGPGYGHPDILTHRRPEVTAIAIHPAGHFFAVGYSDGCIAFWAVEDEDQPLLVRTVDTTNVNVADMEELEKTHEVPPPREPIYKLAWSAFSNSSDPRGGETALTILGGLVMAPGEATGLNVQWLPAFNPPEPPNPTAKQTSLHPFMRAAMQASLLPTSDFFYYTPGIPQEFFLVPRNSPHFSGHHDPTAILISVESVGNSRVVEAYQFPPSAFLASSEAVTEEVAPSGSDVVDDLESTLKSLTVNDDPHMLTLPTPLWFGSTGASQAQLLSLDRDSHALLVGSGREYPFALPLKAGAALNDESLARELRLAKYQMPRILMTLHRNLTVAIQFHDISAQLLVTTDAPIENHFPKPLHGLTIDLQALLTDAAVVKKTSPSFLEHAAVETAYLARQSLECAVQLASGEVVVYRLKPESPNPPKFTEVEDDELVSLEHVLTSEDSRFAPYFLLTTGKPVSACAISDVGFLAVAYTESLIIVDMRGPRIMLRRGRDKKKDRISIHLHPSDHTHISSLTWTISTIENDPQLRIRLIIGYISGSTEILTVLRDASSPSWRIDSDTKKVETVAHPFAQGTFILDAKTGLPIRATKEQLAQSFQPASPETNCILVAAGAKGVRSFADITGARIAKAEWGTKVGTICSVQIVEKMGSHALLAFTDTHDALAYSLPNLEYLCTLKLSITDASLSCDDTGDWIACSTNNASGIIEHAAYGTVFDFRRAYVPPDITIPKPTVPSQPQPVSLGPTSLLSSWFRFGQSMTGEQLDTLLGGPDRPIPVKETKPQVPANQQKASSVAQQAAGTQSNLYSRLQSAMGERSQMLGDLEDRFNSLEEGSKSMVTQAKRMAAEQSAKSWFGI